MEQNKPKAFLNIPTAILFASVIVAVAIVWSRKPSTALPPVNLAASAQAAIAGSKSPNISSVTSSDHILGNPNAPIKIVEYSDPSCPYCKAFNSVMMQVMNVYGKNGKVAWVYRSFPLDKPDADGNVLHPNAGHESQALECAAAFGGNQAFWSFEQQLYTITPSVTPQSPKGLDQSKLPVIAKSAGIDVNKFNNCLSTGQQANAVEAQYEDGLNAGIAGTPYSFIVTSDAAPIPLPGLQTYSTVNNALQILLSQGNTSGSN